MGKQKGRNTREVLLEALVTALYEDRQLVAYFIDMAIQEYDRRAQAEADMKHAA